MCFSVCGLADKRVAIGVGIGVAAGAAIAYYMLSRKPSAFFETRVSLSAPSTAYVAEPFNVGGSLTAVVSGSSKPLAGESIEIYVDGNIVSRATTAANGSFAVQITISAEGVHTIRARYPGRAADGSVYMPSEASASISVVPKPPAQPPPGQPPPPPSVSVSASKSSLSEDPADFVTLSVCWDSYSSPPASGDYYNVGVSSETEGCLFDNILIPRDRWSSKGCAQFSRRFLDEFIPGTGSWYYPCLGTLRGYVDTVKSGNTVNVVRLSTYSINDVTGLTYDPGTGTAVLTLARDVKNMAIVVQAWTENAYGAACRGLIDPGNTAASRGMWITSTQQMFNLFTGIYPQDIKMDSFVCSEKNIVVVIRRPDGSKTLRAAMR
jgi:hypothetical protein